MASRFLRAELRPTSVTTLHPRRTASLLTAVGADIGTRSLLSAASFTPGNSVGVLDAPSAWQLSPHGQLHWHQYRAPATAGDCLVSLRTPPFEVGRLGTWKQPSMTSAGMFCGGCWGGLLVRPNRHLSSGRSTEPKRLANEAIRAKTVMLVMEMADGSTEKSVVSRRQALEVAQVSNLDLVQVNGKSSPVVCRLMDMKMVEFRRKRLAKANAKRKQQKKEIRMKGMIASHDFERKVGDVKKHLDKGDVVKVVFDAPTHVLKRSLHCLDDLQGKFEELFDPTEVLMKHSLSPNARSRREITCSPKKLKVPAKASAVADNIGASSSPVVDDAVIKRLLSGAREADMGASEFVSDPDVTESDAGKDEDYSGGEGELSDGDEDSDLDSVEQGEDSETDHSDEEEESEEADSASISLDLEEALLWEMEDNSDYGADGELAEEWGRLNTRKSELAPGLAKGKGKDSEDGGSGKGPGRKTGKWKKGDEAGHSGANAEGGDYRRKRSDRRREEGGTAGRGRGGGGGAARGGRGSGFGRGTGRGPGRGEGPGGRPSWRGRGDGAGRGSDAAGRGGERGVGGRGGGGGGRTPPPVRSTPYNWGSNRGKGQGDGGADPTTPQFRWDSRASSVATPAGAVSAGDRGFSARFGGGAGVTRGGNRDVSQAPTDKRNEAKAPASGGRFPPKVATSFAPLKPDNGAGRPPEIGPNRPEGGKD